MCDELPDLEPSYLPPRQFYFPKKTCPDSKVHRSSSPVVQRLVKSETVSSSGDLSAEDDLSLNGSRRKRRNSAIFDDSDDERDSGVETGSGGGESEMKKNKKVKVEKKVKEEPLQRNLNVTKMKVEEDEKPCTSGSLKSSIPAAQEKCKKEESEDSDDDTVDEDMSFPSFLDKINSVSDSSRADDSVQVAKENQKPEESPVADNDLFTTGDPLEEGIKAVHKAVSQAPPENQATADPKGVKVALLNHQRCALTWLLNRETGDRPGGILADDMGLGKTLSMISLIMKQKENFSRIGGPMSSRVERAANLTQSNATLVICPSSLIYQWKFEIQDKVHKHFLGSVIVFHGQGRKKLCKKLASADIVITSYGTLSYELIAGRGSNTGDDSDEEEDTVEESNLTLKKSILTEIKWERIVLDEAHCIKNPKSRRSVACCQLFAKARWCLTGTPIQNNLWDLYALIKFLRFRPFDEKTYWKRYVMPDRDGRMPTNRLDPLVKSILKRRTKAELNTPDGSPLLKLEEKDEKVYKIDLIESEKKIYQLLFDESRCRVAQFLNRTEKDQGLLTVDPTAIARNLADVVRRQSSPLLIPTGNGKKDKFGDEVKMAHVFVYMLRLRQAPCHYLLLKQALDVEALRDDEEIKEEVLKDQKSLMKAAEDLTLTANTANVEQLFTITWESTKIRALIRGIHDAIGDCDVRNVDKCVVVSQWTSLLDIVEYHLDKEGTRMTRIDGKVDLEERHARVVAFNKPNRAPNVMLLSLTAGGVGLNLTGGNHLFLMDLHWNPALEQQAFDRIYRIGQRKKVYVHKFVCQNTLEERVYELQKSKLELAKTVLEGASKNLARLSLSDIRYLFQLGPRSNGVTDE